MPLYEYRCPACGHQFEVVHDVGGSPGPCPVCGATPRKVFSSVGLIFKGSGFHSTDYRKTVSGDGDGAKETSKESPKSAEVAKAD